MWPFPGVSLTINQGEVTAVSPWRLKPAKRNRLLKMMEGMVHPDVKTLCLRLVEPVVQTTKRIQNGRVIERKMC